MFHVFCPQHGTDVIIGNRAIRGLINTDLGIIVVLECTCGERIATVTGRKAEPQIAVVSQRRESAPAAGSVLAASA